MSETSQRPIKELVSWTSIEDEGQEIPINCLVLVWNKVWLSGVQSFDMTQKAINYKKENGSVAYLRIPNARDCLKKPYPST